MGRCVICITSLVLAISCSFNEEISETYFIAMEQQSSSWRRFLIKWDSLIKKVHNSKLTIDYGFSDNDHCQKQFAGQYEQQITDSISKSLTIWLAPLADQGPIVSKFEYRYKKTYPSFINLLRFAIRREFIYPLWGVFGGQPDLAIIFYCQEGWSSHALITADSYAVIHMYQNPTSTIKGVSNLGKYRLTTLLHEIGHAFGLGDTYIDPTREESWGQRYNTSDGGDEITVGTQPISVMSSAYLIALDSVGESRLRFRLQLGHDDIAGMKWLYNYYVAKTIRSHYCPADYHYENSTKGCTPRYPLIFAVKQHNLIVIKRLLNDQTIDVNQQDEIGNTALHYAANLQKSHSDTIYYYLIGKGADPYIENTNGKTPHDLVGK